LESLTNEDVKLENDSKPEACEWAENDTDNNEASNYKSSRESVIKTRSGHQVKLLSKYRGFKMTAAEIWLMQ
jgi:hypothetical protein